MFRAIILSRSSIHCHLFSVQSYVPSVQSYAPSIQSCQFSLGIQSFVFIIQCYQFFFQFGVQSHVLSSTFRVIMSFFSWAFGSTIFFFSQFGIQSHIFILVFSAVVCFSLTFKAVFLVRHSKPLFSSIWHSRPYLQFGVQSCYPRTIQRSKSLSLSQFGVQSYHPIMIGHSLHAFWRSEPHSQHLELLIRSQLVQLF